MSNLLIKEPPLQVLPSLAQAIGLNEAIVLQQLHWILQRGTIGKVIDGRRWVYNSTPEWTESHFPFWSEATVKRAFTGLRDKGIVLAANHNERKYDRTLWYTIDYEQLVKLTSSIGSKCADGIEQDDPIDEVNLTPPIPETTTETTTESEHAPEPDMNPSPPGANIDDYDTELQEMKAVLGQVVNENLAYPPHEQRIEEGAKALIQMRHTTHQVIAGFAEGDTYWYVASHGKKGEKPWVKNVVGEIVTAIAWAEGKIKGLAYSKKEDREAIFASLVKPYAIGRRKWGDLSDDERRFLESIVGEDGNAEELKDLNDKMLRIRFYQAVPA